MKLVEGQLEFMKMAGEFSGLSNSMTSSTLRMMVKWQEEVQQFTPDVLSREVQMKPLDELLRGKVIEGSA